MTSVSNALPKTIEMECYSSIQNERESLTLDHMLLNPNEYNKEIREELFNLIFEEDRSSETEQIIQFILLNCYNSMGNIFDTIYTDEDIEENENIPLVYLEIDIPLIVEHKMEEKVENEETDEDYVDLSDYIIL